MVVLRSLRVYRELFAVLASVLLALVVLHHGRVAATAPSPDVVMESRAQVASAPTEEPAPAEIVATPAAPPPTTMADASLPRKEKILLLGDSMVEVLSPWLAAYAKENGHELVPAIWYGSTIGAWARSPELGRLLGEIEPTLVIVALGSSELTARSIATRKPSLRAIVDRVGSKVRLAWIGPPNWREDTGINDLLEAEIGDDRFFRSAGLELTRKRDGIHPDAAGGRVWAGAIAAWLERDLRIRMTAPTVVAAAPPARVLGRM